MSLIIPFLLLSIQIPATLILLSRLVKGPFRQAPIQPDDPTPDLLGIVSVVVPTLNEAKRISPCLDSLSHQSYELREVIVVDSHSQDNTPNLVKAKAQTDPRFKLINDDPLPPHWVGRQWALHNGFLHLTNQPHPPKWILGIDADTQPQPGLIAGLIKCAQASDYDILSVSPQFILKDKGELLLQPSLLMTLLYRFDPSGIDSNIPERVMANGQCFLSKLEVLSKLGGYECAASSFCDDVTLARFAAQQGYKVGFLDGCNIIKVRMYEGALETWKEWGRSLDLKDAATTAQVWSDLWLLTSVQGLPLIILLSALLIGFQPNIITSCLVGLNSFLVIIRWALNLAIVGSYDRTQAGFWSFLFWLSPITDPLATWRIFLSSLSTPKQWRGRLYSKSN